ncbi:hypothetical protein KLP40_07570 [Hymenobacter sp. NST-14]|uniref:hypothetical protein n=1 Tax=Hymenobacter piscis TaxID=2839984 RepID=UPI001C02BF93|nr:hypothetical protein [Hymenobacter piscis]MBT9393017.1 hypothetical protein [Hymenobacter piscis]
MKTLLKSGLTLALGLLLFGGGAQAQVRVHVNAPYWGPAVPQQVQYYYLPEIDGYYDLYSQSYLFYDPGYGAWISSPVLPRLYAGYDPRFFHPVPIQYVGRQPWGYLRDHRRYCDQWGVRPGRYYGRNWPGHGYAVAPRGGYGPAYYGNRPAYGNAGYTNGYAHHNDRDDRGGYYGRQDQDNRGGRDDRGGYYGRQDQNDRQDSNDQGGRQDRGSYDPRGNSGTDRPGPGNQGNRGGQPTYGGRRGR